MNDVISNSAPRLSALAMALALLLAACSTTTTTAVWKDPQLGERRFTSILVMGVAEDQLARRKYEDALTAALAARGVRAAASYAVIAGSGKLSKEQIDAAVASGGYESVLVTHVLGIGEETVHYPGYYEYYRRPFYDHYYRYYAHTYDLVYRPGYTDTYTTVSLETSLYQAPSGSVAWGMRSESIDPEDIDRLVNSLVNETIRNLAASGLI